MRYRTRIPSKAWLRSWQHCLGRSWSSKRCSCSKAENGSLGYRRVNPHGPTPEPNNGNSQIPGSLPDCTLPDPVTKLSQPIPPPKPIKNRASSSTSAPLSPISPAPHPSSQYLLPLPTSPTTPPLYHLRNPPSDPPAKPTD